MAAASSEKSKDENWCTACSEGLWKLVLRQINAEEAVYVCENPDCTYPVGYEVDFIKRPVPGLSGKKETQESVRLTEASFKILENTNPVLCQSVQPPEVQSSSSDVLHNFCEDNSWSSALDSLLDPEVAAYLDSAQ